MAGLGDGGAHCGVLCDASFPTTLIQHWGRDRTRGQKLPLERLVRGHSARREFKAAMAYARRWLQLDPWCEAAHRQVMSLYAWMGEREGSDWVGDWDETNASATPSQPAADETHAADRTQASSILEFNGQPFFANDRPPTSYTEAGSGQYYVSGNAAKRASFADAAARHQMLHSRFHKSKYMCGTCHDVSNPVLDNWARTGPIR